MPRINACGFPLGIHVDRVLVAFSVAFMVYFPLLATRLPARIPLSAEPLTIADMVKRAAKPGIIEELNSLGVSAFHDRLSSDLQYREDDPQPHVEFQWRYARDLSPDELSLCFDLIETTSRQDYEASSWGWHPRRKQREMREAEMRYLLVWKLDGSDSIKKPRTREFAGFLSFMLTHDSVPAVPVLYIYEIHLANSHRGQKLGYHLMTIAESIAQKAGVDKVMLTCFLSNTLAHNFYKRLGYAADVSSPEDRRTRNKCVKTDYVIMSKGLRSAFDPSSEDELRVSVETSSWKDTDSDRDISPNRRRPQTKKRPAG